MRNYLKGMTLLALAMASTTTAYHEEYTQPIKKSTKQLGANHKKSKQNQTVFRYDDGFICEALNQKNADKKHRAWINKSK